jgi:N-methylhydantoinase B
VRTASGDEIAVPKIGQVELNPGDRIIEVGGGGGGFGAPDARDPERVISDVRNGLVSRQRAREVYKVACVDGPGRQLVVDEVETRELRGTVEE